ncbi:peptidase domain-containing ABC transporter [Nitrogeniibacter aestuarii]|uniref:peptidase domain-containing ABC transporter n=1 Tax=Nitrogeniibacter aestuarii TaxID=2815343 RepID=UPI001D10D987|nr:peptidase domain-containing ABC transporter [Nitrogeniibacter aestuarii]
MTLPTVFFGLGRRLPLMLQTEATECGLACLGMVAGYHGFRTDLARLRRRFPVSQHGATLGQLLTVAHELGLASRPLRLDLEDLSELRLPCILHWNMNHFVVLKRVGPRHITIHDPASGERRIPMDEVSRSFTGVALELWPTPAFRPSAAPPSIRFRDLIGRVDGLFGAAGQILTLALVLEVFALVSPFYLQWVIDHVLVSADRDLLTTLALGFGLLLIVQYVFSTLRAWILLHVGTDLKLQWRANVFSHLLRLPMVYFERRHLGDIVSRFGSVDEIQRVLTTAFFSAVLDGLMSILTVVMMFLYSPPLAGFALAAMVGYSLIRIVWFRPLRNATEEEIVHEARQHSHFLETVRGIKAVKLFGRQEERRASWLTLVADQVNASVRTQRLGIAFDTANGLLFGLVTIVVIWLGAREVLDGVMTVGMLMAFKAYKDQFDQRIAGLIERYFEMRMLRVQGERLADIVLEPPEAGAPPPPSNPNAPTTDGVEVRLRQLRFRYADTDPYVLDGIDLSIPAGQSVAIIGPSGCGKTTLMNLLLGIFAPSAGEIEIGGLRVDRGNSEAARRLIGTVTQDDTLFAGSIADNICFFDPHADRARIEACARMAHIHDDIARMAMGYNTLIGDMGTVLSGGQKQRVFLARALYKQPQLLILDEATSHLDVALETAVNEAVKALPLTRIIIAHRPETILSADRVITLYDGAIAEDEPVSALRARHAES